MPITGKNGSFSFAGTLYGASDCLQTWGLDHAINEVVYQCGGLDKGAAGTTSAMFNVSLALDATDTAKVTALTPGATGVFEAHPAGDAAGRIEVESTQALVVQANMQGGPNNILTIDLRLRLNDITLQAAT